VSELFANYFENVVGLTTEELKTKSIYSTTNKQRIRGSPQEILYVGDSGIDMQTATNAGMGAVGVSWATDQEELLADGAIHIINSPLDLITLL
jgi:phosphoglycolate phosphatase